MIIPPYVLALNVGLALLVCSGIGIHWYINKPDMDELYALYHIQNIADCKNMTMADFRLDTIPEHLREKARNLAEVCIRKY